MTDLTKLQSKVLAAVGAGCKTYSAIQEVAEMKSRGDVYRVVMALKERGMLDKPPSKHRAIKITREGLEHLSRTSL